MRTMSGQTAVCLALLAAVATLSCLSQGPPSSPQSGARSEDSPRPPPAPDPQGELQNGPAAGEVEAHSDGLESGTAELAYTLRGLDFSPYVNGQDPNLGSQVSEEQLRARMQIIAPYTRWIRTYGCTHGLEAAGRIAGEMGLLAAIGAWLDEDLKTNNEELENLVAVAQAGQANMLIVGSEVLLKKRLSENQLLAYIKWVRERLPNDIPVTTAEVYGELLAHPNVIEAVDVVFVNYYPYWEGIRVDTALAAIHAYHRQMVAATGDKAVIVSESGWPSCGNAVGQAVPNPENADFYVLNFVSWARATGVDYFYFEAFDETWKAKYEGPQGACWGVWDKDGVLKPGREKLFQGATVPNNWTVPGGPGQPKIEFTYVPPYGSEDDLTGQIWHVAPPDHKVAVYIYVDGGWWNKPTFANPLTPIHVAGHWICDITTGGKDPYATRIVAYLLPNGYDPPLLSGAPALPPELGQNALAMVEATRSP